MPPMKRIGIVVKAESPETKALLKELVPWLRARGKDPLLDPATAKLIGETASSLKKDFAALADMLVVFGGDGTITAASRPVERRPIPILVVNTGGRAFLTPVTCSENQYYHLAARHDHPCDCHPARGARRGDAGQQRRGRHGDVRRASRHRAAASRPDRGPRVGEQDTADPIRGPYLLRHVAEKTEVGGELTGR